MKQFRWHKLNLQISLQVIALLIFVFIGLGFYLYQDQKSKAIETADLQVDSHLNDLFAIVDAFRQEKEKISLREIKGDIEEKVNEYLIKSLQKILVPDSLANAEDSIKNNLKQVLIKEVDGIKEIFADEDEEAQLQTEKNIEAKQITDISETFNKIKYFKTGFPYIVDKSGKCIVYPKTDTKDISNENYFRTILFNNNQKGTVSYEENGIKKREYYNYYKPLKAYICISVNEHEIYETVSSMKFTLIVILLISIIFSSAIFAIILFPTSRIISRIERVINDLAQGKETRKLNYQRNNELGQIVNSLNNLIEGLNKTSIFAKEIGRGNFDAQFTPLSNEDVLGNALLEMRQSIQQTKIDEENRKIEDQQRSWATEGIARFGEILRQHSDNFENLADNIIKNLVKYLNSNQGGLFIYNDNDPKDLHLELLSAFAYERKKYAKKKIEIGEGIIGTCVIEKETVYLTDVPDGYIEITSGLGKANPNSILIVPLKLEEEILGVIEIASLNNFKQYEIDFVEKIAESIASTLSTAKINKRTSLLLTQSQEQAKILAEQEEEMRQNMEELQATQEEAARKEAEAVGFVNSVNHTIIRADFNVDGTLEYANYKFLKTMGYKAKEITGQHVSTFLEESDKVRFERIWHEILSGGQHFEEEVRYKTKTGKIWLIATYTPVRDKEGNIIKILYLGINVDKQKRVNLDYQGEIKAIESSIFKSVFKPDGIVLAENELVLKTLGYRAEEKIGKTIFDFLPTEHIDYFKTIWNKVLNGQPTEIQERRLTKEENEKWLLSNYTPVRDFDGKIYKIICISTDITKQYTLERETKTQNEKLVEQEKNLRLAQIELNRKLEETRASVKLQYKEIEAVKIRNEKTLEGALDAIITIDQNGIVLFFNEAAENLWKMRKEQIINKNVNTLLPEEYKNQHNTFIKQYLASGIKKVIGKRIEKHIIDSTGKKIPILLTIAEAKVAEQFTFTAFIQNISVELF